MDYIGKTSNNMSDKYSKIDRYDNGTAALYSYNIPAGNNIPWAIDPRPMPLQKPIPPLIKEPPLPYPLTKPIIKLPGDRDRIYNW